AMRDAALDYLKACAAERRLTSYGELWKAVERALNTDLGNHWRQLPVLLGHVSYEAFAEFELIPTALVVAPGANDEPGPGFFRIAAELGVLPDSDSPAIGETWTTMSDRQREFWLAAVEGMYDRFAPPE